MKNIKMFLLGAVLMPGVCVSGTGCSGNKAVAKVTPAAQLRQRLDKIAETGNIMFGQHDATVYGKNWSWEKGRCDMKEVCGDYPAIINWDLGWLETGSPVNLDSVPFERMKEEIVLQDKRGGLNSISWHVQNPLTLESAWDTSVELKPIKAVVTEGTPAYDRMCAWIGKTADFINGLKDENGEKIAVVYRPWHEHTGGWFWWGKDGGTPEDYKALWKLTRKIFDEKGVDNVLWAYSPDKVVTTEEYFERYPGDQYVDIMGADIYMFDNPDGKETYLNFISKELPIVCSYASEKGKLAALTETGYEGLPHPGFFEEILLPAVKDYPLSYITVWRNSHNKPNHYYVPYKGHRDEEEFKRFYKSDKTLFLKEIKNK